MIKGEIDRIASFPEGSSLSSGPHLWLRLKVAENRWEHYVIPWPCIPYAND